jgi:hydroxyacylglutathione hydrolase
MRVLQLLAPILCCAAPVLGAPVEGSLPLQWNIGAGDCKASPQPPLQVHAYETQTFILRESPCADPEANFLYLLIGSEKALLIDTGAVADPSKMPLARTVLSLLPTKDGVRLPLLIVHTHRHRDHYAGDVQFFPATSLCPADLHLKTPTLIRKAPLV